MKRWLLYLCFAVMAHSNYAQVFTAVRGGRIVATRSDSRSVNFIDVNRDGWQDIFISNGLREGQSDLLYLNNGDGSFVAATTGDLIEDSGASVGASFADYDNDGHSDAYVTNWYGQINQLYQGDGNGGFARTTPTVMNVGSFAEAASWGDYDGDGLLDLYVTNSDGAKQNFLFRNQGNGQFSRITEGIWVTEQKSSRSVNWTDVNLDGRPDLFVTNENNTANDLYLNEGQGGFTKIIQGSIVVSGRSSMSSSWGDIDNDGDFDLFVANAGFFSEQNNQLFINEMGSFTTVTSGMIVSDGGCSYGSNFGDYDNDGDLDLIVTNGFCNDNLGNFLYENQGDGSFLRRDSLLPDARAVCSYGVAWGDINNDGFLDLMIANCKNADTDNEQTNSLYLNNGNMNNWLKVKLRGTVSNRDAIGAKVKAKATINGQPTWQIREISAQSGYSGQNSLVAHFGVGDAPFIDSLVVEWPGGDRSEFTTLSPNQLKTVTEGLVDAVHEGAGHEAFPIKVFPNPISAKNAVLNIELDRIPAALQGQLLLFVYDTLGQVARTQALDSPGGSLSYTLDLSGLGLPAGSYFLKIQSGRYARYRKLIVN